MAETTAAAVAAASGFTAEQNGVIASLAKTLTFLGPLLVVAGILRLAFGVVEIAVSSWAGLLILPQGLLLAFAGLTFIAGASDASFLATVKGKEKPHLAHTIESILAGFNALLILGGYVAFIAFIKMFV